MVALSSLFASLVPLAMLIIATPVVQIRSSAVTLPIAIRINATGSAAFVRLEQQRAQALIQRGKAKAAFAAGLSEDKSKSIPVTNSAITYTIQVGVGTPATDYTLVIDTGSSNTWVGANKPYQRTSSSVDTGNGVAVSYGSGSFSGEEFTDTVNLGGGLVIHNQSIGAASQSQGFHDVNGILGIGPLDLTSNTLSSGEEVPTVMDNLAKAGTIPANSIGIFFAPTTTVNNKNGELTFGGIDSRKVNGRVTFVPITSTSPSNQFWGIDQTITYGHNTKILGPTAGIVDTGTTLMLIASDAFQAYTQATGATIDPNTGLLTVPDPRKLKSLFYKIGGTTFEFTAAAQQWPKALNTIIGGNPGSTYLVIGDMGSNSGQGLDFINGYTWLEHFYSVFDTDHQQVGIGKTH